MKKRASRCGRLTKHDVLGYNLRMPKNKETTIIQNPAMLAAGCLDDVLIWRQQSGVFRAYDDPRRLVRVGEPGMADAGMIVAVTITPDMVGKRVGIAAQVEFKRPGARQNNDQKNWQRFIEAHGGQYAVITSADEMLAAVEKIRSGDWQ